MIDFNQFYVSSRLKIPRTFPRFQNGLEQITPNVELAISEFSRRPNLAR